jgi:hypothetical protein
MARWLQISLLAPFVALALAGCGSGDDGTIPEENGNELLALLDAMQSDIDGGDCETIDDRAAQVQAQVQALPADVDPEVKTELLDAAAQLEFLSVDDPPEECVDSGATGESGVEPVDDAEPDAAAETPAEPAAEEEAPVEEEPATTEEPAESPSQDNGPPSDTPGNSGSGGGGGGEAPSDSGGISGEFEG